VREMRCFALVLVVQAASQTSSQGYAMFCARLVNLCVCSLKNFKGSIFCSHPLRPSRSPSPSPRTTLNHQTQSRHPDRRWRGAGTCGGVCSVRSGQVAFVRGPMMSRLGRGVMRACFAARVPLCCWCYCTAGVDALLVVLFVRF